MVKNPPANAGDIRDLGSSLQKLQRGGGHGNPQQYSCMENPMDRETWWATVHVIAKNQTQSKHLIQFSLVDQSCLTLSLWLHGLKHGFMSYLAPKYHFWWDVFSYGLILWSYPSGFFACLFYFVFYFWGGYHFSTVHAYMSNMQLILIHFKCVCPKSFRLVKP